MIKNYRMQLISAIILLFGFVLCRYMLFGVFHKMKSWPTALFVFGVVIILVSMLFKSKYMPFFTSLGYIISFAIGVIFEQDYADPTGAMTMNNLWIIWTYAYLCFVLVGIIADVIKRKIVK